MLGCSTLCLPRVDLLVKTLTKSEIQPLKEVEKSAILEAIIAAESLIERAACARHAHRLISTASAFLAVQ